MMSVFRLLHESHLIFCKYLLEKVKRAQRANANIETDSWFEELDRVVASNFQAIKGQQT